MKRFLVNLVFALAGAAWVTVFGLILASDWRYSGPAALAWIAVSLAFAKTVWIDKI